MLCYLAPPRLVRGLVMFGVRTSNPHQSSPVLLPPLLIQSPLIVQAADSQSVTCFSIHNRTTQPLNFSVVKLNPRAVFTRGIEDFDFPLPGNLFKKSLRKVLLLLKRDIMTSVPTPTNGSLCRQNYHEDCEGHLNRQINMELYASYVYMSMAYYFDRDDIAFPGLHKYFKKASDEEREHAEKIMKYQNMRGGRITLQPISKPSNDEWNSPLDAITAALELEKSVNANLLKIHGVAEANNDPQLCDFLETHFLEEQVKSMKELSDFIIQLKRCGSGLGEFIFDKELEEKE